MNECCEIKNSEVNNIDINSLPKKFTCPINEQQYHEVEKKTILQHIQSPWEKNLTEEKYYFCNDPACDVVYFGIKGSIINKAELHTLVGKKEINDDALLCYCFGISKALAKENAEIKAYVVQQTKEKNCACDIRNPSGRCCLKDFPKSIQ